MTAQPPLQQPGVAHSHPSSAAGGSGAPQLENPLLHVGAHAPPAPHVVAVAFAVEQARPHAPQAAVVVVLVSQPLLSTPLMSQSPYPAAHPVYVHLPLGHVAPLLWVMSQVTPHDPQLVTVSVEPHGDESIPCVASPPPESLPGGGPESFPGGGPASLFCTGPLSELAGEPLSGALPPPATHALNDWVPPGRVTLAHVCPAGQPWEGSVGLQKDWHVPFTHARPFPQDAELCVGVQGCPFVPGPAGTHP